MGCASRFEELLQLEKDPCKSKEEATKVAVVVRAFLWIIWCNRNDVCFKGKLSCIALIASEVITVSSFWQKNRGYNNIDL